MMQYLDKQRRTPFISDGISSGRQYGSFYRKPSGALKRVVSRLLPMRDTRVEAEADLAQYARRNGLKPADSKETP
jgi:hypothetical protein